MRRTFACGLIAALVVSAAAGRAQSVAADPELTAGLRLVDVGDFEGAVRPVSAVVKRLQGKDGQTRELSRAELYLGIAHLGLGASQNASSAFAAALKADPGLTLSADEFPPRVIQAFEQARREAGSAGGP